MRIYRWFLISLIAIFFGFIFLFSSRAQENLSVIIKRIQPSVVVIITYDEKGKLLRQGNGFFISRNGDVITNRYLLQGANRAEVKTMEGKAYPVKKILAEDKEGDLIRISVKIPQAFIHPLPVIDPVPEVGERIIVIGSPLGLEQTVSDGIVSAVRDIPEFGKIIQITAPISSGSSGSPVVDMKGDVIGVVVSQIVKGQNLNFAIPAERVTRLKPDKGKSFAEWGKGSRKEWLTERPFFLGLSYLWAEDYENALTYFKDAVKKNPGDAKAYFYVGYCNVKLDERYTEAIEVFKQAIRIKPDYAEAYRRLGMAYAKTGRVLETNEAFEQAIKINPDYAEIIYNSLGELSEFYVVREGETIEDGYKQIEKEREAIRAYKEAVRINPNDAEAYRNLGKAYSRRRRYTEAIEAFKQAVRINPNDAEAYRGLGEAYSMLRMHAKASGAYEQLEQATAEMIEAYKQVVRINPDDVETHRNLGEAYNELRRDTEAIEAYKQIIRINPDDVETHRNLGEAYYRLGKRTEAIEAFKQAIRINPNDAEAYRLLGGLYKKLGKHTEAIETYKQAIKINPNDAEAHYFLGIAYDDFGRYAEAIEAYKQVIRIISDYDKAYHNYYDEVDHKVYLSYYDEVYRRLGEAYDKLGRHTEASEAYEAYYKLRPEERPPTALRIDPNDAKAHFKHGMAYYERGKFTEAIELLKQAVRIKPDYAEAYRGLGVAYYFLKRYTEAIEALKQAIKINPNDAQTHYFLGISYLMLKDRDSALKEYKILKDLNPDHANELLHYINNRELLEGKPRKQN